MFCVKRQLAMCHDRETETDLQFQFQYNDSLHPYWMDGLKWNTHTNTNTCAQTLPLESVLLVIRIHTLHNTHRTENTQTLSPYERICMLFMSEAKERKL